MRVVEEMEVLAAVPKLSLLYWVAGLAWVLMEPRQPHQMWLVVVVT